MGWNNSSKVMSTPISIGDIQTAVDCQSGDLGSCIIHGDTNEWSAIKPMRSTVLGSMTASDRESANYGFRVDTVVEDGVTCYGISGTSIASVFNVAVENEGKWPYARPRGYIDSYRTEWFRMLDFDGYHGFGHSTAFCPISASEYQTAVVGPRTFSVFYDSSAEIAIEDVINESNDIPSEFDFFAANVYIIYKMNGTNIFHIDSASGDFSDLKTTPGGLSASLDYTLPPGSANQVYTVVVAASDWHGTISNHISDGTDDDGYTWVYLPNTLREVTVTYNYDTLAANLYYNNTTGYADSFTVDLDASDGTCVVYTNLWMKNMLENSADATDITITGTLYDSDAETIIKQTTSSYSGTLENGSSDDLTVTVSADVDVPSDAALETLYYTIDVSYKVNGSGSLITKHFDFTADALVATQQQPTSLADIFERYQLS